MKSCLRIPKIFSDGCVLQQGKKTKIWGWGTPGEYISISLKPGEQNAGGQTEKVHAACAQDGRFEACFPELIPGGPFVLEVAGEEGGTYEVPNVYVGDVFVCGGQSNMELPMRRVRVRFPEEFQNGGKPAVHVYKVTEHYDFHAPLADHVEASWKTCTAENLEEISAFSYFFGGEIAQSRGIPVGILNVSLGGTPVEAWMSREGLQKWPEYLDITERYREDAICRELSAEKEREELEWYGAIRRQERIRGQEQEKKTEGIWRPVTLPCYFNDAGLEQFCGSLLLRRSFTLPKEQAGKAGILRFGTMVDSDEIFINGVKIGETGYQYPPRRYPVPEGLLKEGENEIQIHLVCRYGGGRVTPGKDLDIIWYDVCSDSFRPEQAETCAEPVELSGEWEYQILARCSLAPKQVFLNRTPAGLFNGMVAPCIPYNVCAAVWYQGEANDSHPQDYAELLAGMIQDWRRCWGKEELPFVIVQLPNCAVDIAPGDAWPQIREAQMQAERLGNVAVTVNLDLGEDNDLHPLNKKAVAQRAALAVRGLVYKETVKWKRPELLSCSAENGSVRLLFRAEGGLLFKGQEERGEKNSRLFELAGEDGVYYPASAEICGYTVTVSSGQVASPRSVRYAWSKAPGKRLLYGENGLCAGPFQRRTDQK